MAATMLALENLVGSLGDDSGDKDQIIPTGGSACFNDADLNDVLHAAAEDVGDLWTANHCSVMLSTSDITANPSLLANHLLGGVTGGGGGGGSGKAVTATSPSRQSCVCPLCGRHIAQRRSLKQHLMSNFHRLRPADADTVVKEFLATLAR